MFVKAQLTRPRPVARRKYFNILNYHQGAAPAAPTEPQDAVPPYPAGRRYSWDMVPDAAGLMRDAYGSGVVPMLLELDSPDAANFVTYVAADGYSFYKVGRTHPEGTTAAAGDLSGKISLSLSR